jgi:alkylation response protein AidB-like acyl-CoA dehydrogenase
MVAEALECLGGNGLVEENGVARLYREAAAVAEACVERAVWEGLTDIRSAPWPATWSRLRRKW